MSGPDTAWQRLDPRMLLVGPVQALRQFALPALFALIGLSSSRGDMQWWLLPVAVVGVLVTGAIPWLTTRYRIADGQFQQRTGLVSRRVVTAPLDRVRSVDLESSLLHRALGLTKVKIGTGVDDSSIELNALSRSDAEVLQRDLLARQRDVAPSPDPDDARDVDLPPAPPPQETLATLDWSWLRFAPLNLARLAVVAGAVGALSQFFDDVPVLSQDRVSSTWESLIALGWVMLVLSAIVAAIAAWVVIALVGYVLQWSGLRVTRDPEVVRLTAGLLTTRSVTIEEQRIRGIELVEPALMRAAGGAELRALATGVSDGTTTILPPSPLAENHRVAAALLDSDAPLSTPLVSHGPLARRRAHVRHQRSALVLVLLTAAATWFFSWPWTVPLVVLVVASAVQVLAAELEWRHLGHALTPDHLVSGSGALARRRTVLERDGVIGWVVDQSWFQRRVGLATLTATTAAGDERVSIMDVPLESAVALAADVTPGAVGDFVRR